ncbi:SAM-dependent methyltransferase [Metabacillus idriensis]|uniref:SAM-dependent methyltransferase n=1 Tax=Metabacillus idriensis TaxID=324768 RepID=UPI00174B50A2|nr:SAM-dependent methyltransferase [Metabacillus idriensis]
MKEQLYDELLNIKTIGDQKGFSKSLHYHRYEPTPYHALEILFTQYELKSTDRLVDYGCGKGRLNFYINHLFHASAVGVEMNETFYEESVKNCHSYLKKAKISSGQIHFLCCLAEEYQIDPLDNRFYFFNPFSIQIFMNVLNNILVSAEKSARDIELILYYGSNDYTYFLNNHPAFELKQEVLLPGLYEQNPYERFLIYRLSY